MEALLTLFAVERWLGRELMKSELLDGSLFKLLEAEDFDEAFNVSITYLNSQIIHPKALIFSIFLYFFFMRATSSRVSDQLTARIKNITIPGFSLYFGVVLHTWSIFQILKIIFYFSDQSTSARVGQNNWGSSKGPSSLTRQGHLTTFKRSSRTKWRWVLISYSMYPTIESLIRSQVPMTGTYSNILYCSHLSLHKVLTC